MAITECKKCKRLYDPESHNDKTWHKESWGCEQYETNRKKCLNCKKDFIDKDNQSEDFAFCDEECWKEYEGN